MKGTVTCVWTNGTARELYERYERHLGEVRDLMAIPPEMRAKEIMGTAEELDLAANQLVASIQKEMRELVQHFAMPAAIIPKQP